LCGIAGFTHKRWSPGRERIELATATLTHRGPDQQGVFRAPLCSLGATRLKILDLHAGDQPIQNADGSAAIVFNGEIYNHLELRRELEQLGHTFQTHCDTETVFRAFQQWDVAAFARLRGMFALAVWDSASRRLVLARDRIGIKPLYMARLGEDLLFGSELKAILIHPEIDRRLSLDGLDCYLSMNYVPAPWTLVDGIEKVLPGYWVEWRDGRMCSEAYWRLPQGANGPRSLQSAAEELDWLLQSAVKEHLLSDVPLGVWLSGGVDSSTILHYAAQGSSSKLKTFSISFSGRSFDESGYIKRVVEEYGTEHEQLDLNPEQDLCGAIEEFAYYSDEPSADAGALPVWFLSKLCKTQTTVALSGEGADELFGGYLTYRANRYANLLRKLPEGAVEFARRAVQHWPASDEKISFEYKLKRLLEGSRIPPEQAHVYWNGTFSEVEKDALLRHPLPNALDAVLDELRDSASLNGNPAAYLRFDQKYYLPDDILVKSDRMSMAHAVEVRPPFLDHRIIEFAAGLPPSLLIRGSQQKILLKHVMKDKLPAMVIARSKMGFDIPAHDWLRGPLRPLLMETLQQGTSEYPELFRAEVLEHYLQCHLRREVNVGYHLWGLMTMFLWMKRWKIQVPSFARTTHQMQPAGVGVFL